MESTTQFSHPMLTASDVSVVKAMLARGDRQHDIAAWFGVNGGRIAEIAKGRRFWWVEAANSDSLPPPGPYPGASALALAVNALHMARAALHTVETAIFTMQV